MTVPPFGKVYLVGAGPGDPELITVKGRRCLESADAILYDGLVSHQLLEWARDDAELIYVGKRPRFPCADQRAIEALLIEKARAGKIVVRLKGGDPFVFGRGGEEAQALRSANIPFEVIPGISSALAAPAYAGIPVTHRSCASSFAVVTGHKAAGGECRWGELLRAVDTLVILMGLKNLRRITDRLLEEGCDPDRAAALIQSGSLPAQKVVLATVATIADHAGQHGIGSPAVIVVGPTANFAGDLNWVCFSGLPAQFLECTRSKLFLRCDATELQAGTGRHA